MHIHALTVLTLAAVLNSGCAHPPAEEAGASRTGVGAAALDGVAWAPTGPLGVARNLHTATLLAGGAVLVAGGQDTVEIHTSAELYDPGEAVWSPAAPLPAASLPPTAVA